MFFFFFFSSRRRHTRCSRDWSSDVCSSDLATIGVTVYLYVVIPKGFFPQQDTGGLVGTIQADQSSSFQSMQQILRQFVTVVGADPAVQNVVGFVGGNSGPVNTGR